jgi:hypothetical protein
MIRRWYVRAFAKRLTRMAVMRGLDPRIQTKGIVGRSSAGATFGLSRQYKRKRQMLGCADQVRA